MHRKREISGISSSSGSDWLSRIFASSALLLAFGSGAHAMESCKGEYSAALLRPLPSPALVGLDMRDSSAVSFPVVQAIMQGMAKAGQPLSPAPTVQLYLTYQIIGQGGGASENISGYTTPGGSQTGWSNSPADAPWLHGGQSAALPKIPNYDAFHPAPPVQSTLLMLRAEVRPQGSDRIAWMGVVQCTVRTTDTHSLGYGIGYVLGSAFGKRIERQPL